MTIIKLGEASVIASDSLYSPDSVDALLMDGEINQKFAKFATELKNIAPKAKDFLYFSAIMMHSAEASLLESDGSIKKDASGKALNSHWETNGESVRWVCSDSNVRPYRNANGDIFPERELLLAHKKWIGKPLCLDHKSSSVDMIRGVIVDTYYDQKHKRVIALCALDKINYPDLARKVSTGYATSVSMGTAVGRAVCTDCGKVARIEPDFCEHMRKKSCYGEINLDLNPIELSIVVNGADPQAKIRQVVASANSIATYVENKSALISKLGEDETRDIELASDVQKGMDEIKHQLTELQGKIDELRQNEEEEQKRHEAAERAEEAPAQEESADANDTEQKDLLTKDALPMLESILCKIAELDIKINKLSNEDVQMTTKKNAYFQGAGGDNEPTPGKPTYQKEEADSVRNTQDKQMLQTGDMGPVDGLFPGDEQKKKELQRLAQREEKRMAALAAAREVLQKNSYLQGGGGVNEPTPGKVKYPKEDSDKIRDKEDKQMTGAPPFPGVGKVDGLYGKDQEVKQKLLRAKLTAKFIKAANIDGTPDLGESRWQVYANGSLILTATVNDITGNRANSLYDSVATEDFGRKLLSRVKTEDFAKVASLYKGAQDMGLAAPSAPVAPAADALAAPAPEAAPELAAPAGDEGKSGDPKEQISDISAKLSNLAADLADADKALNEKSDDLQSFEELSGDMGGELPPATAHVVNLIGMNKKISRALRLGIKHQLGEIAEHQEELRLANTILNDKALLKSASADRRNLVNNIVVSSVRDAQAAVEDCNKLKKAFVKYVRGTHATIKRAQNEMSSLVKMAQTASGASAAGAVKPAAKPAGMTMPTDSVSSAPKKPKAPALLQARTTGPQQTVKTLDSKQVEEQANKSQHLEDAQTMAKTIKEVGAPVDTAKVEKLKSNIVESEKLFGLNNETARKLKAELAALTSNKADDGADGSDDAEGEDKNELKVSSDGSMEGSATEVGEALKAKEARAVRRAKLAQKAMEYSDMTEKAHGKGGVTTDLDVKPSGDLAKVETTIETQKAMLDIANAPPRVRKAAQDIQNYVVAGKINPEKGFPGLIAQGLDSDAVKYWKSLYSQSKDGGSQFAAELVKEHAKAKLDEEKANYKVKVARAYALANDMAERAMISKDASSLNTQVNEILEWNDASFESMQRMVGRQSVKTASAVPQVGLLGAQEVVIAPPAKAEGPNDLKAAFDQYFAGKRF